MTEVDEPPLSASRRERNKAATRDAIAQAAFDLLKEVGHDAVTVGMIAERAGVSRRTFFNYFSSFDEALNTQVTRALDIAIEELDKHMLDTSIVDATILALQSFANHTFLEPLAYLYSQCDSVPSMVANRSAAWEAASNDLDHRLRARLIEADPFAVSVFAHTVVGACKAAFQAWYETVGSEPTPADTELLKTKLTEAMEYVKNGFPTIASAPSAPSASPMKGH